MDVPDPSLIALGIQQPWAELILRGVKTVEVRTVPVAMRSTIYIYASKKHSTFPDAHTAIKDHHLLRTELPTGLITGTVDIIGCRPCTPNDASSACVSWDLMQNCYSWLLDHPQRFEKPIPPRYLPYGMWFFPFRPRNHSLREVKQRER